MRNKFLIIWAVISTAAAIAAAVMLVLKWNSSKPYVGLYRPIIEPAKEYIDVILDTSDYDCIAANEYLTDLKSNYRELSVLYEMFMADYHNEPYASCLFFMSVESLYDKLGLKIPPLTFNFAFELLKKGAEQGKDEFGMDAYRYCCHIVSNIYDDGIYVPRDTVLANHYSRLARSEQ